MCPYTRIKINQISYSAAQSDILEKRVPILPNASFSRRPPFEERRADYRTGRSATFQLLQAAMLLRSRRPGPVRGQVVQGDARVLSIHAQRAAQHQDISRWGHHHRCKCRFTHSISALTNILNEKTLSWSESLEKKSFLSKDVPYQAQRFSLQVKNSNATQVVLRDIEFNLSGKFSCEVTTDKTFSTRIDTQTMLVVRK